MKKRNNHIMFKRKKPLQILLIIYLIILIRTILFKWEIPTKIGERKRNPDINLIPFAEMTSSPIVQEDFLLNILVFIPLGILLSACFPNWNRKKKIWIWFLLSIWFEIIQYITALWAGDITDIISNTWGTVFGISIYYSMIKLFKGKPKVDAVILRLGYGCCIALFLLGSVLWYANS